MDSKKGIGTCPDAWATEFQRQTDHRRDVDAVVEMAARCDTRPADALTRRTARVRANRATVTASVTASISHDPGSNASVIATLETLEASTREHVFTLVAGGAVGSQVARAVLAMNVASRDAECARVARFERRPDREMARSDGQRAVVAAATAGPPPPDHRRDECSCPRCARMRVLPVV